MTGKELIEFIQKNKLEEKTIVVINPEGDTDNLRLNELGDLVVDSCVYC